MPADPSPRGPAPGRSRPSLQRLSICALSAGVAVAGLGTIAVLGWLLDRPLWVQLRSDLAPIQFNTALGLALLGLALVVRAVPFSGGRATRRATVRALAAVTLAITGLTLFQYLTGGDLGLDQLFVRSRLTVGTSRPGRMAPDAALGLLLGAGAVLAPRRRAFTVAACASLLLAVGALPLLGYAAGLAPLLERRSVSQMSLLSAVSFTLLGVGLVALGFRRRQDRREEGGWRFPLTAGVATALATLWLWQALERREAVQLQQMVNAAAERIEAEVGARLEARAEALELVASFWEIHERPQPAEWSSDSRVVLDRYPELIAVEWLGPEVTTPWVFSRSAIPLPPPAAEDDPALGRRLETASREDRIAAQGPLPMPGGEAFRLFVPVELTGGARGFAAGLFLIDELVASILEEVAPLYFVHVAADGSELFEREVPTGEEIFSWSRQVDLEIPGGLTWSLTVRPSSLLLPAQRSRLTTLILVAGLSLALLLTAALRLRQTALAQARDLSQANRSLTAEIENHRRAEEEIRRLNAELELRVARRTEELARSNEDLRQFASFVSHELRQPLNSLALWTDLLRTTNGEALDEKGHRYLGEIRGAIHRMGELITGQLALSDLASREERSEAVDLHQVVDELGRDLGPTLRGAGARLEVGALPVLRGDPSQIYQLLRNLVDNAVKYRRAEAPLTVRMWSEGVAGDGETAGGGCRIYVEDNGRGFPPEERERIFQLFERLDPGDGQGSGMGLAICQRVVERLGGEMSAEGRPGAGATFVIELPPEQVARAPAPAA